MNLIISIFGVQIPTLIVILVLCFIIQILVNKIFNENGVYDFVWHPGLFRTAVFACIFTSLSLIIYK